MAPAREGSVPVERRASGAAVAFDGNHTRQLVSWMFPNENWLDENVVDMLIELMLWTDAGHLAWVVFPPQGFRL